jgi:hypothetical protein
LPFGIRGIALMRAASFGARPRSHSEVSPAARTVSTRLRDTTDRPHPIFDDRPRCGRRRRADCVPSGRPRGASAGGCGALSSGQTPAHRSLDKPYSGPASRAVLKTPNPSLPPLGAALVRREPRAVLVTSLFENRTGGTSDRHPAIGAVADATQLPEGALHGALFGT